MQEQKQMSLKQKQMSLKQKHEKHRHTEGVFRLILNALAANEHRRGATFTFSEQNEGC
ncbi:MAG: hypothetical protein JNL70_15720 [Saprospiraceae bacterium]|nr:hypothetical protein [Saprospiraceae bacterium]